MFNNFDMTEEFGGIDPWHDDDLDALLWDPEEPITTPNPREEYTEAMGEIGITNTKPLLKQLRGMRGSVGAAVALAIGLPGLQCGYISDSDTNQPETYTIGSDGINEFDQLEYDWEGLINELSNPYTELKAAKELKSILANCKNETERSKLIEAGYAQSINAAYYSRFIDDAFGYIPEGTKPVYEFANNNDTNAYTLVEFLENKGINTSELDRQKLFVSVTETMSQWQWQQYINQGALIAAIDENPEELSRRVHQAYKGEDINWPIANKTSNTINFSTFLGADTIQFGETVNGSDENLQTKRNLVTLGYLEDTDVTIDSIEDRPDNLETSINPVDMAASLIGFMYLEGSQSGRNVERLYEAVEQNYFGQIDSRKGVDSKPDPTPTPANSQIDSTVELMEAGLDSYEIPEIQIPNSIQELNTDPLLNSQPILKDLNESNSNPEADLPEPQALQSLQFQLEADLPDPILLIQELDSLPPEPEALIKAQANLDSDLPEPSALLLELDEISADDLIAWEEPELLSPAQRIVPGIRSQIQEKKEDFGELAEDFFRSTPKVKEVVQEKKPSVIKSLWGKAKSLFGR